MLNRLNGHRERTESFFAIFVFFATFALKPCQFDTSTGTPSIMHHHGEYRARYNIQPTELSPLASRSADKRKDRQDSEERKEQHLRDVRRWTGKTDGLVPLLAAMLRRLNVPAECNKILLRELRVLRDLCVETLPTSRTARHTHH